MTAMKIYRDLGMAMESLEDIDTTATWAGYRVCCARGLVAENEPMTTLLPCLPSSMS
jgi:hypothetical protein